MNKLTYDDLKEIFDGKNLLEEFLKEVEYQIPKNLRHKIPALPEQGSLELKNVLGSYYFCS